MAEQTDERLYPVRKRWIGKKPKGKELVVLFTAPRAGEVVKSEGWRSFKVGEVREDWNERKFTALARAKGE